MNRIMIIILIVGLFSCKKEVEPDTYYCVTAQIVNGTTGDTLYTALPISIDLERNDQYGRPAVPRHITSSKMSAKDGKFSFRYSELKRQQGEGQLLNIKMTIAGGYYFIPVNQNVDTIIYKSNQAHVYIYIKTEGYTNMDTLYTYYRYSSGGVPIFDTLVLPHNGLFRDIYLLNSRSSRALAYRINRGGLEQYYDYKWKEFKNKNIEGLKGHYFDITGDPYKDTTTLILKK